MIQITSIISERNKKKSPVRKRYHSTKKVEDKIDELKRGIVINYYLNGGM